MHSLKILAGDNESKDLDEFAGVQSVKNELSVKKDGKGSKRKRSEQSEEFPTSTSASTVPMQNIRTRATSVPTTKIIKKESKGSNSNDSSAEGKIFLV